MKEVFLLTKILFKNSINLKNQNQKKTQNPLKFIGWILLYAYIAGIIGYFSYEMISSLKLINQQAVFLNLCLIVVLGMNIMRSLFTSINLLFFSKDIEFLLPMPVKSKKIVMAKINCMIISEYIMQLLIFAPALLVYGVLLNSNLWFYIIGILIMLLIPIVPIMLVSLIVTIIMRFTNLIRNKDFVQYITVFLSLILVFGIQLLTGMDSQVTNEEFANMLVETNGLIEVYTKFFFTLKPAMQALINCESIYGVLNLFVLILQTIIIYLIVIEIMSKFYIKTVTNTTSSSSSKKRLDSAEKHFKQKSITKTYVKKEFQSLVRNPIFLMQCIIPSILFPLLFTLPIYITMKNGEMMRFRRNKNDDYKWNLFTFRNIYKCSYTFILLYV